MLKDSGSKITHNVAQNLRRVRGERKLSLDGASQLTGVSKAMLGQIERGESSPTIATLWKIATGLQCSFSSFLGNTATTHANSQESSQETRDETSALQPQVELIADPNMQVLTLFPFDPLTSFEVFELVLSHHHEQHSTAHQAGVTERIHVISGVLSVMQNGQWETLKAGEQCVLAADKAHAYRDDAGETRFMAIIHYPQ
ncbi:helix-turn-helix domain-containing protein [Alteromonas sp.]|jgi:transcriptional regulator with XRE-family HTH domain|uniref:helix-turn-helix domain-containing protein n=1 Tax=Alteromonas sp. TaxID=232 RepID=UPI000B72A2DC|nr:helix-turn-helix domain-containing protein [Alteromonas sp.]MAI37845.1 XRE family transcriptional regulator [Alteromonas sp.]OUX87365.1 MAG: XRE family transcriptional regulator [Alteromonas sp. TMED35]|tara:strand:+ start:4529 stop:5128 length:600 start_codon:yes stop_codon:yes gene_type:complete